MQQVTTASNDSLRLGTLVDQHNSLDQAWVCVHQAALRAHVYKCGIDFCLQCTCWGDSSKS